MASEATVRTIRRGDQTRVVVSQHRTVPEPIYRAALTVVEAMTWESEGLGRLDKMRTLLELVQRLGCVLEIKVGCESSYCPDPDAEDACGAIALDATMPRMSQIRCLAHEIAHHMLYWEKAYLRSELRSELASCGSEEAVEEMICQVVEDLVFELPSGLTWSGKLAPPRGDGTVKWFRRTKVKVPSQQMPISEIDRLLAEMDE